MATDELPQRSRLYFILGVIAVVAAVAVYVACYEWMDRHEERRMKDGWQEGPLPHLNS